MNTKEDGKTETTKYKSKNNTRNKVKEISSKTHTSKKKLNSEEIERANIESRDSKHRKNQRNLQIKDIKNSQAKIQEQYKDTQNKIHVLLKENFAFNDVDHS